MMIRRNNMALHGSKVRALALLMLTTLSACQLSPHQTVNKDVMSDIDSTLDDLASAPVEAAAATPQAPAAVLQALVPGLTLNSAALQPVDDRFDFAVTEPMDARKFFALLTEGTNYSIALHPNVSGTISALDLKNVTIDEALQQVSQLYGFEVRQSGNIYQVLPGGMQTRMFKVDYLDVVRQGNSSMQIVATGIVNNGGNGNGNNNGNNNNNNGYGNSNNSNGNNGNGNNGNNGNGQFGNGMNGSGTNASGSSVQTNAQANYWEDLEDFIKTIISANSSAQPVGGAGEAAVGGAGVDRRSVVVSPQTGMIVVRAYPDELDKVAEFLEASQTSLQRQVVLEAKILEVELKEGFQTGIDIDGLRTINGNPLKAKITGQENALDGISGPLSLGFGGTDFSGVIRLLETQGNVQVVSSPRISTLNNQKAVFKVGDEEYFVTDKTTTFSNVGNQAVPSVDVSIQPFFSGIAFDVTPQISAAGDVILHIHPILNSVQEDVKNIGGDDFPLASSSTRESDSIARARNGEVIIISGLMQTRARGTEAGVPGISRLPVVGNVLESRQRDYVKTELVILLRAIVDEGGAMQKLIKEQKKTFGALHSQVDPGYR
jgi:MSHA biogenesis protein MshL